jgi:peroxiredoxin
MEVASCHSCLQKRCLHSESPTSFREDSVSFAANSDSTSLHCETTVTDVLHSLRLGSIAPNFKAETTQGPIDFHEFIGDKWAVLFSHPEDYTPVCTTELGAFAKLEPEFTKRGVKLIGLSANTIESHGGWIKDIDEISGSKLSFPIIGDKERKVAYAYDM